MDSKNIAEKIEKYRLDKSISSAQIAELILEDLNQQTFKPIDASTIIKRLESFDLKELISKVNKLEEWKVHMETNVNTNFINIFKNIESEFKSLYENDDKIQKQINLILKFLKS